jgi:hypothetical protein
MGVASKIPVRGGGTLRGEPDDWFPGGGELEVIPGAKPEGSLQSSKRKVMKEVDIVAQKR